MSTLNLGRIVTALYAVSLVVAILWFRPGCVHLVVWASLEKSELLGAIATRYEQTARPSEDLRCVDIDVVPKASGDAENALARGTFASGEGCRMWSLRQQAVDSEQHLRHGGRADRACRPVDNLRVAAVLAIRKRWAVRGLGKE